MPTATAQGKTFNFPEGTTPEQMGSAIDEYFSKQGNASASSAKTPLQEQVDKLKQNKGNLSWAQVPGEAISNIPKSGAEFAGNIVEAVKHPITTAENLGHLVMGGIDKAASSLEQNIPEPVRNAINSANNWIAENIGGLSKVPEGGVQAMPGYQGDVAEQVGQYFADRYGGEENLKKTIAEDPVGFAADAATVLTAGGGLAAKIPGIAKVGETITKVGSAINPVSAVTKTAKLAMPKGISEAFMKAHKMGYKVPPALAKGSKTQQFMEGTAGPVPTKQKASIYNQQITNKLIKEDIGYPKDVPLSSDGLNAIRLEAGKTYDAVSKIGDITTDNKFSADMARIAGKGTKLAKEFPGLVKKDVQGLVDQFNKDKISSEAAVEAIKQMRADANAGFASTDPSIKAMAKAQKGIADSLESLIERNAPENLIPELKAARQKIAKTYQIEKVLKGDNVDAVALGRELDKGKPMTGTMRDVAEFGQKFKGAAQVNPPQQTNFRPMDVLTGIAGSAATGNNAYLAAMFARPALRSIILSHPYQKLLAKAKPIDLEKVLNAKGKAQITALNSLMNSLKNQETSAQGQQRQQK